MPPDQVGHKVDGTEDVGALDAAGQHDCNGKGADVDEHGGDHGERCRKTEGMQEGGILEHGKIVLDAHKVVLLTVVKRWKERKMPQIRAR